MSSEASPSGHQSFYSFLILYRPEVLSGARPALKCSIASFLPLRRGNRVVELIYIVFGYAFFTAACTEMMEYKSAIASLGRFARRKQEQYSFLGLQPYYLDQ